MDIIYRYDPFAKIVARPEGSGGRDPRARGGAPEIQVDHHQVEQELMGGSSRGLRRDPLDPLSLGFTAVGAPLQVPFALVLGCSDARAPIERIFDPPSNDLFVIRVAGNVLGTECLGSIDYAVQNLKESLRLLVVLGHSGCGAVTAAVDSYLSPRTTPISASPTPFARWSTASRSPFAGRPRPSSGCGPAVKQEPGYRAALIETAVYLNAALTAFDVRKEIDAIDGHSVRVVYGVFDLVDQRVHALPHRERTRRADLRPGSEAPQGFHRPE